MKKKYHHFSGAKLCFSNSDLALDSRGEMFVRDAIIELLPEINWVKNLTLREAVLRSYVDALTEGDGTLTTWISCPLRWLFPIAPRRIFGTYES